MDGLQIPRGLLTAATFGLALAIGSGMGQAPAAAQNWNLNQQAVDACEHELTLRMGSETRGRDPQASLDSRSLDVRDQGRNSLLIRGGGSFRRDRFDQGRAFTFDCTVDIRNGNTTANYRWGGGNWGGGYDDPGYTAPPAYRPPPSGGWGGSGSGSGNSGGSSYPPTGRVFYSGGITNRASGKGLDVQDRSTRDAANVQQHRFHNGDNQLWRLERVSGGFYQVISVSSGKCLDVDAGQINENGANVQQWSCSGQPNQQWKLGRR